VQTWGHPTRFVPPGATCRRGSLYAHVSFKTFLLSLFIFICWHRVCCHCLLCNTIWGPVGTLPVTFRARETSVVREIGAESLWHRLYFQKLRVRTKKASCNWNRTKFNVRSNLSPCHAQVHAAVLYARTQQHGTYTTIQHSKTRLSQATQPIICAWNKADFEAGCWAEDSFFGSRSKIFDAMSNPGAAKPLFLVFIFLENDTSGYTQSETSFTRVFCLFSE